MRTEDVRVHLLIIGSIQILAVGGFLLSRPFSRQPDPR